MIDERILDGHSEFINHLIGDSSATPRIRVRSGTHSHAGTRDVGRGSAGADVGAFGLFPDGEVPNDR